VSSSNLDEPIDGRHAGPWLKQIGVGDVEDERRTGGANGERDYRDDREQRARPQRSHRVPDVLPHRIHGEPSPRYRL
jgi:hypothetical protein